MSKIYTKVFEGCWIPWTVIDDSDKDLPPIPSTCGTCGKDMTGNKVCGDMEARKAFCDAEDWKCPCDYSGYE